MARHAVLALFPVFAVAAQAGTPRSELLGKLPLRFEDLSSKSADRAQFIARGPNFKLRLAPDQSYLDWTGTSSVSHIRTRLLHANPNARMEPAEQLDGVTNYFIGRPESWRTGVAGFGRIRHHDVYPGIDLVFHGEDGRLEYDFVVAPHADPGAIQMELTGQHSLRIASNGDLIVSTSAGEIRWKKPKIFQDAGATPVSGRFVIVRNHIVRFDLGSYHAERLLVIDPALTYSTYLGGSNSDEARGIGRDASGNVYIGGNTNSMNLDTLSAFQPNFGGRTAQNALQGDGFVAKFSPAGVLLYLTYIGGSRDDFVSAMVVDSAGDAYLTGATTSPDFPTTPGAFQTQFGGAGNNGPTIRSGDAFVAKLNPTGNKLLYSTYLGGSQDDVGMAIAIDSAGDAYVTGSTVSYNFPVAGDGDDFPYQSENRGVGGEPIKDCYTCTAPVWDSGDAFVTKLNPTGTQLIFSTYIGGAYDDFATSLAIDSSNNVYIAGCTLSGTYPVTSGAFQTHFLGNTTINPFYFGDGFVTKMNSTGSALIYSTFIGGTGDDCINAIALDSTGAVYLAGSTNSTDLPVTAGAPQSTFSGFQSDAIPYTVEQDIGDAFVGKLDPTGSTLLYLTYLGGSRNDAAVAIAVDSNGAAYVGGFTDSTNFPLAGTPLQSTFGGDDGKHYSVNVQGDAFLTIVNPSGTAFDYSTYLGGNSDDSIGGILLDGIGNVYIAGGSASSNFPVTSGAAQTAYGGNGDAVYAILSGFPVSPPVITSITNAFNSASATIAPNSWIAIRGTQLAQTMRTWGASDFTAGVLPTVIDKVTVTFNGNDSGYIYYVSGTQLNVLTPPDLPSGSTSVQVAYNGVVSAPFTVQVQPYSISFFNYNAGPTGAPTVVATHLDGTRIGPANLIAGVSFTPASPGEEIVVYANGFGPVTPPVVKGSVSPAGVLPSNPPLQINGTGVTYNFSGINGIPGTYQFNIYVPSNAPSGELILQCEFGGQDSAPVSIFVQ